MALLTTEQRRQVWAEWMRENRATVGITKDELKAAMDAVDDWVDANTASFNTAIPQPARGALTSTQKAHILMMVVRKRFIEGV